MPHRSVLRQVCRVSCLVALLLALPWSLLAQAPPAPVTPATAPAPAAALAPAGKVTELAPGIVHRFEQRQEPRPLAIHVITLDLRQPGLELAVVMAPDPDAEGPANAVLTDPLVLARDLALTVAINANSWDGLPGPDGKADRNWRPGQLVSAMGLVAINGQTRVAPQKGYEAFWLDTQGAPHFGQPPPDAKIQLGLAGFGAVLRAGKVVGGEDALHPRTVIGFDASTHRLFLVVVDGRQGGYSEGMRTRELGELMLALGCQEAINLDGGGSSVLLAADAAGAYRELNRPSTRPLGMSIRRPVPVVFGVRLKPAPPRP